MNMIYTPEAGETQLDLTFATEMPSFHDLCQYKVQMTLKILILISVNGKANHVHFLIDIIFTDASNNSIMSKYD